MKTKVLMLGAALLAAGCSPETRCVRGIDGTRAAVDAVREDKQGLAKASPALLKAEALLGAAEVARAARNYDGCIDNVAKARKALDEAR